MGSWLYPDWVGGPMPAADVPFVGPGKGHNSDFFIFSFHEEGYFRHWRGQDNISLLWVFTLGLDVAADRFIKLKTLCFLWNICLNVYNNILILNLEDRLTLNGFSQALVCQNLRDTQCATDHTPSSLWLPGIMRLHSEPLLCAAATLAWILSWPPSAFLSLVSPFLHVSYLLLIDILCLN